MTDGDREEVLRLREENLRLRERELASRQPITVSKTDAQVVNVKQVNESFLSGCAAVVGVLFVASVIFRQMQRLASFTCALAALAVSGCYATSTTGLKDRGPTFERSSQRSVIQIVECINDKWEVSEKGAGRYSPRENGATLAHGLPTMVVDIDDTGTERSVTFYRIVTLIPAVDARRSEEVSGCL